MGPLNWAVAPSDSILCRLIYSSSNSVLTGEHGPGPGGPRVVRFIAMFWAILVLIPIGTGYPYTRIQVRTRELTLESGIMDPCLNRLRRVQCVSSRELHGARRADSNRLARLMLMRTDF